MSCNITNQATSSIFSLLCIGLHKSIHSEFHAIQNQATSTHMFIQIKYYPTITDITILFRSRIGICTSVKFTGSNKVAFLLTSKMLLGVQDCFSFEQLVYEIYRFPGRIQKSRRAIQVPAESKEKGDESVQGQGYVQFVHPKRKSTKPRTRSSAVCR